MVLLYLIGTSTINHEQYISTFVAGIMLGIGIGSYYMLLRIQETKKELQQVKA